MALVAPSVHPGARITTSEVVVGLLFGGGSGWEKVWVLRWGGLEILRGALRGGIQRWCGFVWTPLWGGRKLYDMVWGRRGVEVDIFVYVFVCDFANFYVQCWWVEGISM